MALTNNDIYLPSETVQREGLSSEVVTIRHLFDLVEFQEKKELKLAPKLAKDLLEPSHFNKMNVGAAMNVLSEAVAGALRYMALHCSRPEMLTTAWWIETVRHWFNLMNSRNPGLAFSLKRPDKYQEAITHVQKVSDLFQDIKVGTKGNWKPIQTGVIMASQSMLLIVHELLTFHEFGFVLTSRFSQDALENTFSLVRMKNPLPTPKQVKYGLRAISISQFSKERRNGNYEYDDSSHLADFLEKKHQDEDSEPGQVFPIFKSNHPMSAEPVIDSDEESILYYVAGNTFARVSCVIMII